MKLFLFTPYNQAGEMGMHVLVQAKNKDALLDELDRFYAESSEEINFSFVDVIDVAELAQIPLNQLEHMLKKDWPLQAPKADKVTEAVVNATKNNGKDWN